MRPTIAWILAVLAAGLLIGPAAPAGAATASETFVADGTSSVPVQDQLAIDLARAAAAGRAVRLRPGVLELTRTLWLPPRSRLMLDAAATLRGAIPGQSLIRLQTGSRLSGGTVMNTSPADCLDVDVAAGTRDAVVDGVTMRGAHANAGFINAPDVQRLTIRGNRLIGTGYGVLLNPGALRARTITITDNEFVRTTGDAVEINAAIAGKKDLVRDVRIVGNTVRDMRGSGDGSGFAIGMAGVQGFRIANNHLLQARNEAVHLEDRSSGGVVERNLISGGGSGWRPAIAVYRTVDAVKIRANAVRGFDGGGIAVLWDSKGSSTRIGISRNIVSGVSGDGIVVGGDSGTGPFTVVDNAIRQPGGDGIAVLGTHSRSVVDGNLVRGARAVLVTRFAGEGTRVYTDNGAHAGRSIRSVVGAAALRVESPSS